jgi:hypothetical protein
VCDCLVMRLAIACATSPEYGSASCAVKTGKGRCASGRLRRTAHLLQGGNRVPETFSNNVWKCSGPSCFDPNDICCWPPCAARQQGSFARTLTPFAGALSSAPPQLLRYVCVLLESGAKNHDVLTADSGSCRESLLQVDEPRDDTGLVAAPGEDPATAEVWGIQVCCPNNFMHFAVFTPCLQDPLLAAVLVDMLAFMLCRQQRAWQHTGCHQGSTMACACRCTHSSRPAALTWQSDTKLAM